LAVIESEEDSTDTTELVKTLLAFGADPTVIPKDMWSVHMNIPEDIIATRSSLTTAAAL